MNHARAVGMDISHAIVRKYDGVGKKDRIGLNFTERGFGVRAALGCSDRGHTAISQLKPGEIDWEKIFGDLGGASDFFRTFFGGGGFQTRGGTARPRRGEDVESPL